MSFDLQAIAAADRLVKGTRVYVEGSLSLDKWKAQDGTERQSVSRMARLPTIGRNRPKRDQHHVVPEPRNEFHSDPIGF